MARRIYQTPWGRGVAPEAMSIVKINAITVPAERADMMAQRFAARVGEVGKADGFEEFQLLRPDDERTTWLVYTRWRDEDAFEAWRGSQAFGSTEATAARPAPKVALRPVDRRRVGR